jgi:hypothetical protein
MKKGGTSPFFCNLAMIYDGGRQALSDGDPPADLMVNISIIGGG